MIRVSGNLTLRDACNKCCVKYIHVIHNAYHDERNHFLTCGNTGGHRLGRSEQDQCLLHFKLENVGTDHLVGS